MNKKIELTFKKNKDWDNIAYEILEILDEKGLIKYKENCSWYITETDLKIIIIPVQKKS